MKLQQSTYAMINSEHLTYNLPYYAYVTFLNAQTGFYGGGCLISSNHVVTSGANVHTFTSWRVGLGSQNRSMHTTFNSNRAVAHPNYNEAGGSVRNFDIGIIFLNESVEFSFRIKPVYLPPLGYSIAAELNVQGMIAGFALSSTSGQEGSKDLQAAHVRRINDNICVTSFSNANFTQHFCAEDSDKKSDFCLGDQVRRHNLELRDPNCIN